MLARTRLLSAAFGRVAGHHWLAYRFPISYTRQITQSGTRSTFASIGSPFRSHFADYATIAKVARESPDCHVSVEIPDGSKRRLELDKLYLRDSCSCRQCVDPTTSQKLFETTNLPLDIGIDSVEWISGPSLEIIWKRDIPGFENHKSLFSLDFLVESTKIEDRLQASRNSWPVTAWDRKDLKMHEDEISFDFAHYMNDRETFRDAVFQLHHFGIIFVKGVPQNASSVESLAKRIGPLRQTFYGKLWDVVSAEQPINVAYTADNLDFHMDLLYMANPPSVQFLHCINQSVEGGESRFSDALAAFYKLQSSDPDLVEALVNFPVTYRYKNNGEWYQYSRPFLEGGVVCQRPKEKRAIDYVYPLDFESISWGPQFQGPFEQVVGEPDCITGKPRVGLRAFVKAARKFKQLLQSDTAVFETKMEEGTCIIFNNRRITHARNRFGTRGGKRWLRGCYVDGDCLRNQFRLLVDDEYLDSKIRRARA